MEFRRPSEHSGCNGSGLHRGHRAGQAIVVGNGCSSGGPKKPERYSDSMPPDHHSEPGQRQVPNSVILFPAHNCAIIAAISEVIRELANRAILEYYTESEFPRDTTDAFMQQSLLCQREQKGKSKGLLTSTELARLYKAERLRTLMKVFVKR